VHTADGALTLSLGFVSSMCQEVQCLERVSALKDHQLQGKDELLQTYKQLNAQLQQQLPHCCAGQSGVDQLQDNKHCRVHQQGAGFYSHSEQHGRPAEQRVPAIAYGAQYSR
jgi:hypothetical protein